MRFWYFTCLIACNLLWTQNAVAEQAQDSCLSKVPPSLAKLLLTKFPDFRLPLVKDGQPSQIEYSQKQGYGDCVLVTIGDFDGNRLQDVAILLPRKLSEKVILVGALQGPKGWSVFKLPSWCESVSSCYVGTDQPGKYEMTESFDYTTTSPDSRERITSKNQVIVAGTPESTGIVYAYIKKHWLYVWVSD